MCVWKVFFKKSIILLNSVIQCGEWPASVARPDLLRVVVTLRSVSFALGVQTPVESQQVVVVPLVTAAEAGARDTQRQVEEREREREIER